MQTAAKKIWIEGAAGRLEALLHAAQPAGAGAILAHPHPLHGGTMHTPVIFHAERALRRAGFSCLRFNFRGVGASDGVHDKGQGELDDLARAVSWMRDHTNASPLLLVGYSFGAYCAIRLAAEQAALAAVICIGLPVRAYDIPEIASLSQPVYVIQGSHDEYGSPAEIGKQLRQAPAGSRLFPLEGADHVLQGRAAEAATLVVEAAQLALSG
jgi:alpha/beta superfamily hydrolase